MSPDGRWAYTLYQGSDEGPFVHALDTTGASGGLRRPRRDRSPQESLGVAARQSAPTADELQHPSGTAARWARSTPQTFTVSSSKPGWAEGGQGATGAPWPLIVAIGLAMLAARRARFQDAASAPEACIELVGAATATSAGEDGGIEAHPGEETIQAFRARLASRRPSRVGGGHGESLPAPLAGGPPGGILRRPRRGGRGGHRPGGVPGCDPVSRPLRPPPPVRPLVAPDRGQSGDRLGSLPVAAARGRGRARKPSGARRPPRPCEPESGGPLSDEAAEALASLSPEHRAVVVLRYLLDYTPGEIARCSSLPAGHRELTAAAGAGPFAGSTREARPVNERQITELFGGTPAPDEREAEERGWRVVQAAFEQRSPARRPARRPNRSRSRSRSESGAAGAGSDPRRRQGRRPGPRRRPAGRQERPAGAHLVADPGRLLVTAPSGSWVVADDGGEAAPGRLRRRRLVASRPVRRRDPGPRADRGRAGRNGAVVAVGGPPRERPCLGAERNPGRLSGGPFAASGGRRRDRRSSSRPKRRSNGAGLGAGRRSQRLGVRRAGREGPCGRRRVGEGAMELGSVRRRRPEPPVVLERPPPGHDPIILRDPGRAWPRDCEGAHGWAGRSRGLCCERQDDRARAPNQRGQRAGALEPQIGRPFPAGTVCGPGAVHQRDLVPGRCMGAARLAGCGPVAVHPPCRPQGRRCVGNLSTVRPRCQRPRGIPARVAGWCCAATGTSAP